MPGVRGGRGAKYKGQHKSMLWVLELSYSPFVVVLDSTQVLKPIEPYTPKTVYMTVDKFFQGWENKTGILRMLDIEHFSFVTSGKSCKNPPFAPCSRRPESHQHTGNNVHLQPPHGSLNSIANYGRWLPCHLLPLHMLFCNGTCPPAQQEVQPPALESGLALTAHLWLITDTNVQAMSEQVIRLLPKPLRAFSLRTQTPYWEKAKAHRAPQRPALGPADHPGEARHPTLQRLTRPLDWMTACADIWLTIISQCFQKEFTLELVQWVK